MPLILSLLLLLSPAAGWAAWPVEVKKKLEALDEASSGVLGVYAKKLNDGTEMEYQAGRPWYLSSTTKVPVAIVLLKQVEEGKVSLTQSLTLKQSDFVDGSGEVIWKKPGASLSVGYLLEKMLTQSDSTAADMLIRLVGEDELNAFLKKEGGFGRFSTILDVRYGAFGELHPKASSLTNLDFIEFKKAKSYDERLQAFASRIGVARNSLRLTSLEAAFEKYYSRGENSSSLVAYGKLLEKLVRGELLSEAHTKLIFQHMGNMTTGERRLKAGLPAGNRFVQKTGTQVARICNVGVVNPERKDALVITACVEKFGNYQKAEALLKDVGKALAVSGAL